MADFNFDPPKTQLFGGQNTAWEPLGQESQLKNYKLGMSDVYNQISMAPDTDGIRVSVSGSSRREDVVQQALNEWGQNSFPAPTNPMGGFGSNPTLQGQQMASQYTPPSNWGGVFPAASIGGSPVNIGQFSPQAQSQIFAQMGGSPVGSNNDAVAEATETISKLGKALKEDFIPAAKDSTEQVSKWVGAMTGRDASGGGFGNWGGGGGGLGTWNGGDSNWGSGNVRPEMMDRFGYGKDMPRFTDSDFEEPQSGLSQWASKYLSPDRAISGLRRASWANRFLIQPAMDAQEQYRDQMANQDASMLQSGVIGYNDAMGGQYGQLTRRNINAEERQLSFGKQVDAAYGGFADMALGGDAARGPLGAIAGIGGPALGVGLAATSLLGGPIGLIAGGATAIAGGIGYASSAMKDYADIGKFQNSGMTLQALGQNFEGGIGQIAGRIGNDLGLVSDSDYSKIMGSGALANDISSYASGGMTRNQLLASAKAGGYSGADALGAGNENFIQSMAGRGISRDSSTSLLSMWQRYNSDSMPSGALFEQMAGQSAAGVDWNNLSGIMAGQNMNPLNQSQMSQMQGQISNYLAQQPAGTNIGLMMDQMGQSGKELAPTNALRVQAGLPKLSPLTFQSELYQQNPSLQAGMTGLYDDAAGDALQSSSYYNQVVTKVAPVIQGEMEAGAMRPDETWHLPFANRMQNAMQNNLKRWEHYETRGGATPELASAMQWETSLSQPQQNLVDAMASGDRMVLSQNAGLLGDSRYRTLNTDTGLGIFEQEKRSLQDTSTNINRGLDTYQYNQQTAMRNIGYQTMTGGATGVGATGMALGGDGLSGLSALFQAQGMNLQTGNGMGMWQIEDASTSLSRQQQQYRLDQGGASLGLQGQNRDLSNRQWQESFAMNQQQFTMQTEYQSQNMSIDRGQQITQTGWQNQDMAMDRNKMEMSFGWQQEDYDRNIRFSRGRQRVDLMREQERSAITHSMDETQQGNQEERAKTVQQWQREEYDRKKQYFDESKGLAQEEMNMNKRHHDEKLALDNAAFELTKENHEKEKTWMTEEWALEDQRRLLTRQNDELQYKTQTDLAQAARDAKLQLDAISDVLKGIGRTEQNDDAFINKGVGDGTIYKDATNIYAPKPTAPAPKPTAPAPKPTAPAPKHVPGAGYLEGGFTGSGPSGGVAGVVHNNEYVVPEGGALVVRGGGGESLAPYLIKMIAILEKGIMNATIYTNADNVNTGDVYKQAGSRFKK